jgi:transposase-like protein
MKKYSEEEKTMWVEDWKQSGASLFAYAKANGLNLTTLKNWVKESSGPQDFVEVKPELPVPMGYIPEILIEKGDIKVHIPAAINRQELRAVIQSLGWSL